jgi:hypothetical protein
MIRCRIIFGHFSSHGTRCHDQRSAILDEKHVTDCSVDDKNPFEGLVPVYTAL